MPRSKDRTELESSDEHAEKTHPEYSKELEELCEQLRATLDGLVRARDPVPAMLAVTDPGEPRVGRDTRSGRLAAP